jgi:Spy/CpxP family protein refolding chaperone
MKKTMVLAFLSLLGAAPAFAHEHGDAQNGQRFERMSEKLGLDAASQAKVQQTFEKFRTQMAPVRQDMKQARLELRAELAAAQPNEGKVSALTTRLEGDRRQMMSVMQARSAELKQELTPSQFAKLTLAHGRRFHKHQRELQ